MITYNQFVTIYKVQPNEALFGQFTPIAEARALIFPAAYRELASQYYLGYMLCMFAGTRGAGELKSFKVEPEGYSVTYGDSTAKCDNWLELLRQLAAVAGISLEPTKTARPEYADRAEYFNYSF